MPYIIICIFVIIISLILFEKHRQKILDNSSELHDILFKINAFYNIVLYDKKEYITATRNKQLYNEGKMIYNEAKKLHLPKKSNNRTFIEKFITELDNWDNHISSINTTYVKNEIATNCLLFDNIDGKSLDEQQRIAVVTDEEHNLVLAGAGSGKTLTISGKVKYLCDVKGFDPKKILLISFTKKSADEMSTRIADRLGLPVKAITFHKLGLDIISTVESKRPDVFNNLVDVVSEYFKTEILNEKNVVISLIKFFAYYLSIPKNYEDFKNLGDYHDHQKSIDFETIKSKYTKDQYTNDVDSSLKINKQTINGERVKSLEEVIIANFLYLHGIIYEYERLYPYASEDKYRKPYRPDFYLPEYDIYLEHFGISENKTVPWLSPIEAQKYLDGMNWKRDFHKKNGTVLLETYSYYNKQGCLLEKLEAILKAHDIQFREVDFCQIFNKVYKNQSDKYFKEFMKMVCTFITLCKSNGYQPEQLYQLQLSYKTANNFLQNRNALFIKIVVPIIGYYNNKLAESQAIDFSDMINKATEAVCNGKTKQDYKYIIIDEYQDISVARYRLVKALLDTTGAKLLCVGDDWQSIYRFAGSDISLFTSFAEYYGASAILKIEKTYRNSQELIDAASKFIMCNPMQMKKDLKSDKHLEKPIRLVRYDKNATAALKHILNELSTAYDFSKDILLLGRTNYDIEILKDDESFSIRLINGDTTIQYKPYPKMQIHFMSIHKSKGLEADNVVILNLENKLLGFPNKIADDPVLDMVLSSTEEYVYAEERRLFYVAITRSKNRTYMLVPDANPSEFISELVNHESVYTMFEGERSIQESPHCPRCKTGYLTLRTRNEDNTQFLGCSHYPQCDYSLNDISVLKEAIICPKCGGFLIHRKGRYGAFLGCTNYPHCSYSMNK